MPGGWARRDVGLFTYAKVLANKGIKHHGYCRTLNHHKTAVNKHIRVNFWRTICANLEHGEVERSVFNLKCGLNSQY